MQYCRIYIQEEVDDNFLYTFNLTIEEILSMAGMPFKQSGKEGVASHRRLNNAKMDIYRLGEEFSISYDNNVKGTILMSNPYSEISSELFKVADKMFENENEKNFSITFYAKATNKSLHSDI